MSKHSAIQSRTLWGFKYATLVVLVLLAIGSFFIGAEVGPPLHVPGSTRTIEVPGPTRTVTVTAPPTSGPTVSLPGSTSTTTRTLRGPGSTATVTLPGGVSTVTLPGSTVTRVRVLPGRTITLPGATVTVCVDVLTLIQVGCP